MQILYNLKFNGLRKSVANTSDLELSEVGYSHHCVVYKSLRLVFFRYKTQNEDSPKRSVLLL